MITNRSRVILVALLTLTGVSGSALAAINISFAPPANTGGLTLVDFNNILTPGNTFSALGSPYTVGGGEASLGSGNLFAVDPTLTALSFIGINNVGTMQTADGTDFIAPGGTLEINFSSPDATTVGFDIFKLVPGDSATLFIEVEDVFGNITSSDLNFDFNYLTFTSDEFISSITLEVEYDSIPEGANGLGFDNLMFGDPTVIPAPGAALLGVIGIGMIGFIRRSR